MTITATRTASYPELVNELTAICGSRFVLTNPEDLYEYGKDQTLDLHYAFDVLVRPGNAEEIAAILKICSRYGIPVTPRGAGSGVTGGALPVKGGVVLAMERLNKILHLDEVEQYVIAEAGVITADICGMAEQYGLCLAVTPSSYHYSMIGGNVAENAGGIQSCRYGSTDRYVMNLEVVLPSGETIWTGSNVSKDVGGLNLTKLFVGSEGILGIITKVVYRLIRKPAFEMTMLTAFKSFEDACRAVIAIRRAGIGPTAVELIGRNALQLTAAYLKDPFPLMRDDIAAHLLISLQDEREAGLTALMERTGALLESFTGEDILTAHTGSEKDKLWSLRFRIGDALTEGNAKYRDIDICVPLSFLHTYVTKAEAICAQYQVRTVCFGHAMDGNLHVMVRLPGDPDRAEQKRTAEAIQEIYAFALANGGVISGEHGIGLLQKEFMHLQFGAAHLELMRSIKQLFDPNGLLNPGKVI